MAQVLLVVLLAEGPKESFSKALYQKPDMPVPEKQAREEWTEGRAGREKGAKGDWHGSVQQVRNLYWGCPVPTASL